MEVIDLENTPYQLERIYKAIFEGTQNLVFILDSKAKILLTNPVVENRTDFCKDKNTNQSFFDFVITEDQLFVKNVFSIVLSEKKVGHVKFNFKQSKNEGIVELYCDFIPIQNSNKEIDYIIVIGRFFNDLLIGATDQQANEEFHKSIIELIPEAIIVHSRGKLLFSNPAALELIGAKNFEEIASIPIIDFVHPDYKEVAMRRIRDVENGNINMLPIKEKFIKLNGEIIDVNVFGRSITFRNSNAILLIITDLTKEIASSKKLIESESRRLTLLSAFPDLMFVINKDGYFLEYNASDESQLYLPQQQVVGSNVLKVLPSPVAEKTLEKITTTLKSEEPTILEYKLPMPNGMQTYESRFIKYGQEEVLVFVRNITEKKAIEEEQMRSLRVETIGLLAGGVAHDFNNILMKILGNVNLLNLSNQVTETDRMYLKEIEKATFQASKLTNQLLTFSKGAEPVTRPESIKEIIENSISLFLSGSKSKVKTYYSQDSITVEVEAGQIDQVINNLVLNADQSQPEGGLIEINVDVQSLKPRAFPGIQGGNYVKIAIKDQGTGISDELKPRIFEPYFTTKKNGTGLGLPICYSIVKRHHGFIDLQSKLGKGSVFTVYLPISKKSYPEKKKTIYEEKKFSGKVLIMDDSIDLQYVTSKMIEHLGFSYETANEGEEAIKKFIQAKENIPFDLLIMDLTIPGGMGGKQALEEILKIDPTVKAIVSSGYSNDPVIANYQEFGFKGILTKPYTIDNLRKIISEIIEN